MVDGYEPHGHMHSGLAPVPTADGGVGRGGVYPGWVGMRVGPGGAIPGTLPGHPGTHI